MSQFLPEPIAELQDLRALQAAINQRNIRRAAGLSLAEKLRMGADLYNDGMRLLREWMTKIDEVQL